MPCAQEFVAGSPRALDAVATRPALGDAAATVTVAMSLDARQQLVLSPTVKDHVETTERPRKVIMAAHALLRTLT